MNIPPVSGHTPLPDPDTVALIDSLLCDHCGWPVDACVTSPRPLPAPADRPAVQAFIRAEMALRVFSALGPQEVPADPAAALSVPGMGVPA